MKGLLQPRRLLAVCLSLLLVLAMAPAVFAEGEVASVGDTTYGTVQGAIDAIADGGTGTVTLLSNVEVTSSITVPEGKTVELVLNGFNLTGSTGKDVITNKGTLTISGNGQIKTGGGAVAALVNYIGATATLEGGTYNSETWYTIKNLGSMYITSDAVTVAAETGDSSLIDNGWVASGSQNHQADRKQNHTEGLLAKLTITAGHFSGGMNVVKNDDYSWLSISGGTFENSKGPAILNWNIAEITGGTFTVNNDEKGVVAIGKSDLDGNKGELTITGGTFNAGDEGTNSILGYALGSTQGGQLTINGGNYNGVVAESENIPFEVEIEKGSFNNPVPKNYVADSAASISVENGTDKTFTVGTPAEISQQIASAPANSTVEVFAGTVNASLSNPGVVVKNSGDGEVKIDGKQVSTGSQVVSSVKPPFVAPDYYPDYDEDVDYVKPEQPEVDGEKSYAVVCRTLNVRSGAGTTFAKIGALSRGTLVKGVEKNGWVQFTFNGTTAYVSAAYVQETGAASSNLSVICRTLNVRSGAGTSFGKIGTLSRGTGIDVVDTENGWYKIAFNGGYGYVSSAYIG